jgi:hypothetical protein
MGEKCQLYSYDQWETRLTLELEELKSKPKNQKEMNQLLEHVISGFKLSLATQFARYYEGTGQWQKAKANVKKILESVHPHQSQDYMKWIITII